MDTVFFYNLSTTNLMAPDKTYLFVRSRESQTMQRQKLKDRKRLYGLLNIARMSNKRLHTQSRQIASILGRMKH